MRANRWRAPEVRWNRNLGDPMSRFGLLHKMFAADLRLRNLCFDFRPSEWRDFQDSKFASQSTRGLGFKSEAVGSVLPIALAVVLTNVT